MDLAEFLLPVWNRDNVEVWQADLDRAPSSLEQLLGPDEVERANRYGSPLLRSRFVARRGLLRSLLASRIGSQDFELGFGRNRKPYIHGNPFHFNVSSTGRVALFAVADAQVGVDIEQVAPNPQLEELIRDQFSDAEQRYLRSLSPSKKLMEFYRGWTLKEACAKAIGLGFGQAFSELDVLKGCPSAFEMATIPIDAEYAAAVATVRS